MKVGELITLLELRDSDAEVGIISESDEDYPALKIWEHPETPDNSELNPEIPIHN